MVKLGLPRPSKQMVFDGAPWDYKLDDTRPEVYGKSYYKICDAYGAPLDISVLGEERAALIAAAPALYFRLGRLACQISEILGKNKASEDLIEFFEKLEKQIGL